MQVIELGLCACPFLLIHMCLNNENGMIVFCEESSIPKILVKPLIICNFILRVVSTNYKNMV